ncbi:hypothetical protein FMUBM48_02840 [Nocardia cyriacigeorgica]|nr:hypothetical protein FMUBM48_02840 [Nocardia cyriacigeorgica]
MPSVSRRSGDVFDHPDEEPAPQERRVDRRGRGSLHGRLRLISNWDSEETNAEIARDFGMGT